MEFEPYGFGIILISKFNIDPLFGCLGYTMYYTDGSIIWYPYEIERNLYGHLYVTYQYNESGQVVYYKRSPHYISNNLQERKYLLCSDGGAFVPAIKRGETYINLVNNTEIVFIDGKVVRDSAGLTYVNFHGHGTQNYL